MRSARCEPFVELLSATSTSPWDRHFLVEIEVEGLRHLDGLWSRTYGRRDQLRISANRAASFRWFPERGLRDDELPPRGTFGSLWHT
jgi:hypothetical protein